MDSPILYNTTNHNNYYLYTYGTQDLNQIREIIRQSRQPQQTQVTRKFTKRAISYDSFLKPKEPENRSKSKTQRKEGIKAILKRPDCNLFAAAIPCVGLQPRPIYQAESFIHDHDHDSPPPPAPADPSRNRVPSLYIDDTKYSITDPTRQLWSRTVTVIEPRVDDYRHIDNTSVGYYNLGFDNNYRIESIHDEEGKSRSDLKPPEEHLIDNSDIDHYLAEIEDYTDDVFSKLCRESCRRLKNRSAISFLELSPDSDENTDEAELYQLPQVYFRRPFLEKFLECRPSSVQVIELHQLPRPSSAPLLNSNRKARPPPSHLLEIDGRGKIYYSRKDFRHQMGRMNPLDDHERKIIIEFCHLLEKSKQLFNGLRELPQYGHKQWHSYFGRTFDVYTKLWKFQQQHRGILDTKYGLKRWQIGEIASKIGQLYYHFYLRTSETAYLNEAFSFYSAIRGRSYYTQASKEDKCELMVKKLRYYARYIVVCLLLKKPKLVQELTKELEKQIVEYGNAYDPDDQVEWTVVVEEVRAFTSVEPVVEVLHPDNYPIILTYRLSPQNTPPVERSPQMTLSLQEVLIIGSNSTQVKFSELTMDMFRMMQTLEREPTGDIQHIYDESPRHRQRYISTPSAVNNKGFNLECGLNRGENPHKYMLFKPSPSQIFVYLASGCNELPPNGALLLYISADGLIIPPGKHSEDSGYDVGGLITTSKTDIGYRETAKDGKSVPSKHKELQVLYPGDLYPFTRRPMFLIVDSDNSYIFQNMPRHFGQPMVILMSPLDQPASIHAGELDKRAHGSLFTLFLHCPLSAFCYICELRQVTLAHWERAQAYIETFLAEASQILTRSRIDIMYIAFLGDDFLRLLILRFIFCETILRMHHAFRSRSHLTRASPALPDDLYEHPTLTHIIMDLASYLQLRGHFHDPSAIAGTSGQPPNKE